MKDKIFITLMVDDENNNKFVSGKYEEYNSQGTLSRLFTFDIEYLNALQEAVNSPRYKSVNTAEIIESNKDVKEAITKAQVESLAEDYCDTGGDSGYISIDEGTYGLYYVVKNAYKAGFNKAKELYDKLRDNK